MLHQVGVSFDLYYDARKHKIKIYSVVTLARLKVLPEDGPDTTEYYFSPYTYIGAVEACFSVLSYACVFLLIRVL